MPQLLPGELSYCEIRLLSFHGIYFARYAAYFDSSAQNTSVRPSDCRGSDYSCDCELPYEGPNSSTRRILFVAVPRAATPLNSEFNPTSASDIVRSAGHGHLMSEAWALLVLLVFSDIALSYQGN